MPRSAKDESEIEFYVPETFWIVELYQENDVRWNQGSPEYFRQTNGVEPKDEWKINQ